MYLCGGTPPTRYDNLLRGGVAGYLGERPREDKGWWPPDGFRQPFARERRGPDPGDFTKLGKTWGKRNGGNSTGTTGWHITPRTSEKNTYPPPGPPAPPLSKSGQFCPQALLQRGRPVFEGGQSPTLSDPLVENGLQSHSTIEKLVTVGIFNSRRRGGTQGQRGGFSFPPQMAE